MRISKAKTSIHWALPCLLVASVLPEPLQAMTDDESQIRVVIDDFGAAIVAKDRGRFMALFHSPNIPWLQVLDEASLERARLSRPLQPKAAPIDSPGPIRFMDLVTGSPHRLREDFRDIRVETDGQIASVWFSYSFHRGDYTTNWGHEAWQLVRTEQGWKINSVIYSVTNNPAADPAKVEAQ